LFEVGWLSRVQVTEDGRIWGGYGDEAIFAGPPLASAGIVSFDRQGNVLFRFSRDAANADIVPGVWSCAAINLVSDDELWVAYLAYDRARQSGWWEPFYALVQLRVGRVERVLPWSVVSDKAPVPGPAPFALSGDWMLLQGHRDHRSPPRPDRDTDRARLYLVSLSTARSEELVPVDEGGEWIGSFSATGRGSKLYLTTDRALFMVDAAALPTRDYRPDVFPDL
jgi:hypothetical protein